MSFLGTSKLQKDAEEPSSLPSMHRPVAMMADIDAPHSSDDTSVISKNQHVRIGMNEYTGILVSAL
jgi:hypothetical protein